MVRKGKVVSDTPEFASYRRIYESIWKKLKILFEKLEEVLNKYRIELVYVDGKRMAVLALKNTFTVEDLINCLVDNEKYVNLVVPKSRFVGV
jgi:predicted metal-dependent hydrolase